VVLPSSLKILGEMDFSYIKIIDTPGLTINYLRLEEDGIISYLPVNRIDNNDIIFTYICI
jgi:hypothetical protein